MRKRREERFYCRIDMSALAAILIVLLSGMAILAIQSQPRSAPPLPRCTHSDEYPNANKEDAISVGVSRDGSVYYHGYRLTSAELSKAVRDAVSRVADPEVYIYADGRASYGAILEAVDAANSVGVRNIGLMTQPFKSEPFSHPLF